MNDTEVDVIDVEEAKEPEDAPEDQAPDEARDLSGLITRLDQLLVVADQVIEQLQQLVTNTTKPERAPLPPKVSGAGEAKKSIYNM